MPSSPDSDDAVSTVVTADLLASVERSGWPIRPDLAAAGLDERALRTPRSWVSWGTYQRLLRALSRDGSPHDLEALGEFHMRAASSTSMRHFAHLVDGGPVLYRVIFGQIQPSIVRVVRSTVEASGPGRVVIRMSVDPRYEAGEAYFRCVTGTMRGAPMVLGLPPARVTAQFTSHTARFEVVMAAAQTLSQRLARAARVLRGGSAVAEASAHLMREVDIAVSNLHASEARRAAAEHRWKALSDALPGLVVEIAPDGTIADIGGTASRASAHTPGAPWAVGTRWVDAFHADDRGVVGAQLARAMAGEASAPIEVRSLTTAARPTWWACSVGPVAGDAGHVVAVAVDITEQHAAREALHETERRLFDAQKLEAIGRLSSGLAHDINNVLAAVQAHAELIVASGATHAPTTARAVEGIRTAVGRASALTRRLLTAAARSPASAAPVTDLVAAVHGARALFGIGVGDSIRFELDTPTHPVAVAIDDSRLEQVLLNLVLNARDAQPDGGVVRVRVVDGVEFATVSVEDEGTGMTDEVLAHATEAFFTTKPVGRGSGLGLATVKDIVARAGGTLAFDTAPGRGTSVWVELPRAPHTIAPRAPAPAVRRGTGERVLLVEDDPDVRQTVGQMLSLLGYEVSSHASAEAAVRALDDAPAPHVIVTDVVMPGMGGVAFLRHVRARGDRPPVLMISGLFESGDVIDEDVGPDAFLTKPFRLGELSSALRTLIA